MIEGVCTHWQGFFGFIEGDDGVNYFAHQTAIRTAKKGEFRMLIPGERYKFKSRKQSAARWRSASFGYCKEYQYKIDSTGNVASFANENAGA